jgi:hypothetical protein
LETPIILKRLVGTWKVGRSTRGIARINRFHGFRGTKEHARGASLFDLFRWKNLPEMTHRQNGDLLGSQPVNDPIISKYDFPEVRSFDFGKMSATFRSAGTFLKP